MRIVALVPAYNEEGSIRETLLALLSQRRVPDVIVSIPNGCSDRTAEISRSVEGVEVLELGRLEHKKSQALNIAWDRYARQADIVICLDADTVLPPNAVYDWEKEFINDKELGGSSSKFTMRGTDLLTSLQRSEFSKWTDTALARGWTSVLAGTGCAISGKALHEVVELTGQEGPWSYDSQVEDFLLTYHIRSLGYVCKVSPSVRAYTDSMKTVRSLWGQRMKWQVGTVEDLLSIGFNRLTAIDWFQQACGIFMAFTRLLWTFVLVMLISTGTLSFQWVWWVAVPLSFVAIEMYSSLRIPHRSVKDVILTLVIIPSELFAWLRAGWMLVAWVEVLRSRVTGIRKDRWELQYEAESLK